MTGRVETSTVTAGSEVFAGTQNMQGELFIEVTSLGADSALGRIVGLMEEAQQSKPVVLQRLEEWLRYTYPW